MKKVLGRGRNNNSNNDLLDTTKVNNNIHQYMIETAAETETNLATTIITPTTTIVGSSGSFLGSIDSERHSGMSVKRISNIPGNNDGIEIQQQQQQQQEPNLIVESMNAKTTIESRIAENLNNDITSIANSNNIDVFDQVQKQLLVSSLHHSVGFTVDDFPSSYDDNDENNDDDDFVIGNIKKSTSNNAFTTTGSNSNNSRSAQYTKKKSSSGIVAIEEDDDILGLLSASIQQPFSTGSSHSTNPNSIDKGQMYHPSMTLMNIMEEENSGIHNNDDIIPGPSAGGGNGDSIQNNTTTIKSSVSNVSLIPRTLSAHNRFSSIGGSGSNKNRSTHSIASLNNSGGSNSGTISNKGINAHSSTGMGRSTSVGGTIRSLFTVSSTASLKNYNKYNSMNNSGGKGTGNMNNGAGSESSESFNVYQQQQQQQQQHRRINSSSTAHVTDELQISTTEYDYDKWTGNGLLANRADLNIPWEEYSIGCHLLLACAMGNIEMIDILLNDKSTNTSTKLANINFRDYDRRTALHVAASEGHIHVCQYLIEHKAHINRSDRWGGSPLDDAHRHRHTTVVEYLRSNGATTGSGNRSTNLINAAASGDIEEVQIIISQFRKVSTITKSITTTNNNTIMIKVLQDLLNKGDYDKRTALHLACAQGHTNIVKELVTAGANINTSDRWNRKPLDDAIDGQHTDTIQYLQSINAERGTIVSLSGTTATATNTNTENNKNRTLSSLDTSTTKRLVDSNLQVEFDSLEMIDRIGSGAFGEIYKCRWRGTLVAAKIIKTAKIRREWTNRKQISTSDTTSIHTAIAPVPVSAPAAPTTTTTSTETNNTTTTETINANSTNATSMTNGTTNTENVIEATEPRKSISLTKKATHLLKGDYSSTHGSSHKSNDDDNNNNATGSTNGGNSTTINTIDQMGHDLAIADFRQEISVLRSLRHPNIVLLLAYSTTTNYECLISELMKCSLLDVFKSHIVTGTRMSARTQLVYAIQLAQGMNYLHTCKPPVVHRDLKPANLLIDHSGVLKISDFGLSRVRPDPKDSSSSSSTNNNNANNKSNIVFMTGETGSYRFMAPEVYRHENYNETVDIYSYSMILYYLFVGRPPWANLPGDEAVRMASQLGDRPTLPRNMDSRLVSLLKDCWDDNPSCRPSFSLILDSLASYVRSVFHVNTNNEVISSSLQYDTTLSKHGCCTII